MAFFSSTIDKWALCTHTGKKPKRDMSRMLIFLKMTFFSKTAGDVLKILKNFHLKKLTFESCTYLKFGAKK